MQEYDLAVVGILWGTALAFALAAVTMVDSGRKKLLVILWVIAGVFLIAAVAWPWLAERWPALKAATENVAANKLAIDLLGMAIFCLFVLDFWLRSSRSGAAQKTVVSGSNDHPSNEALNNSLQGLFERVGQIEQLPAPATAEDHNNLVTTVVNLTKDTNSRVERLASSPQAGRDNLILMNFALYQSTVQMLDSLLDVAPVPGADIPLELGGSFELENQSKKEFVELVRRTIDNGADRRSRFEGVMRNAEYFAENEIEEIPKERRPEGIDHLALRKWAIIHRQCTRAVNFLQHDKREVEQGLFSQRRYLLERFSELNK